MINEVLTEKDEKKLHKLFKRNKMKVEKIINEPSKLRDILKGALNKANEFRGPLDKVWDNLQLFFNLIQDYLKGYYREIPVGSIIAIVASLTYFVSPIDLIPDVIAGIGLFDDIYIINIALKQVGADLQKYKAWKNTPIDVIDIAEV